MTRPQRDWTAQRGRWSSHRSSPATAAIITSGTIAGRMGMANHSSSSPRKSTMGTELLLPTFCEFAHALWVMCIDLDQVGLRLHGHCGAWPLNARKFTIRLLQRLMILISYFLLTSYFAFLLPTFGKCWLIALLSMSGTKEILAKWEPRACENSEFLAAKQVTN